MKKTLCILTIGQSPREDMVSVISRYLPDDLRVIEKGVLDGLTTTEIEALSPKIGEKTLVSRIRNGSGVRMDKRHVISGLVRLINECNNETVDTILLACTGKFEPFDSDIPIIYPDHLLSHVVKGIFKDGELGIVVPVLEQSQSIKGKWESAGFSCLVLASSPYDFNSEDLVVIAKRMDKLPVKAIVLDCMGYTDEMKRIMIRHTTKPILVARNIVFSTLAEML